MTGKYFEELSPGDSILHSGRRTVTEMDNTLFCSLTMNPQPLHLDEEYARQTPFGKRIVNGIYTMGLIVGLSVPELSAGTIVANLGYDRVAHPAPVFHGDTIHVETEVLECRPSSSKSDRGIVKLLHRGLNQDNVIVCEVERTALFLRKDVS